MVAIQSKLNVIRALSAVVAQKAILLFLILDSLFLLLCMVGIWALAQFISPWWWLLLIIFIPLLLASLVIYFIASFIARRIYPARLSGEQRQHLNEFTDKLLRLLETRGMGWWWFLALCIRDLLAYRELRTLKALLRDTTSLKSDFQALEQEFSH